MNCRKDVSKGTQRSGFFPDDSVEKILAAAGVSLDIIDSNYELRYVDETWRKVYGDPLGKKCYEYFMSRQEPCADCGITEALETCKTVVRERVMGKEGGRSIHVTTIPFQGENGEWLLAEVNVDITETKKMEDDLRRVNVFLDSIIENIPDMVFLKDARELRFVRLNKAGEELLGYSREDLIGKNDYDFFPEGQADFFVAKDRETLFTRSTVDVEEECIDTKNKGRRILHTKKVPIRDGQGDPEFLLGISEDVTEKKMSQDALRESEERFRTLVSNVPGVVFRCSIDEKWTMKFVSGGIKDLAGYSEEDMIDNRVFSFQDIIHPEDRTRVRGHILESVEKRDPYQIDYRIYSASGEILWVRENGRGIYAQDGKAGSIDGVIVDITAHVRAEEELHRQWSILNNLIDNIPFYVYWKDTELKYLGCNRSFAEVSGAGAPKLIVEKSDSDLAWKKEESDLFRETAEKILRTGEPVLNSEETRSLTKGKEATVLTSRVPLKNGNGEITGILGIYADITERKESETRLRLFKDLMDQSSDSLFIIDFGQGRIVDCNDQAGESLSYEKNELLSKRITDIEAFFRKEEKVREQFNAIRSSGSLVFRSELVRKTGECFPVEINAKYVSFGGDEYVVAVVRDITERLKIESKLKESEKKYRTIFENTGTITAIIDEEMRIMMANSEFERFFGMDTDTKGKRDLKDIISPEDREKALNYNRLRRIDPGSAPGKYEINVVDASGDTRNTYVTAALIPGTGNTVLSFLDLTDVRAKEFEIARQRDILDSTNKALEHKIIELNRALSHIKRLEGLVPICSSCKKIMKSGEDPKKTGSWVNIEKYISDRTEASFTHGLCPECIDDLYGDISSRKKRKR